MAEKTFYIGAIPDYDKDELKEAFDDFASYLTEKLDFTVEFKAHDNYSQLVDDFANDQVQMAWFGGVTFAQASEKVPNLQALAQRPIDETFQSVFITRAGNDLEILEDLKGCKFTFGNEMSTSGHAMPRYFMEEAGINPDEDLDGKANFSGTHDMTIKLVEEGDYEAGAVNGQYWDRAVDKELFDTEKVVEFYRSPEFYDYNWTVNDKVDENYGEGTVEKIKEVLLNVGEEDSTIMEFLSTDKFIETENSNYDKVKEIVEEVGLL